MKCKFPRFLKAIEPWLWLSPCLCLITMFVYYPFVKTIINSLFTVDYAGKIRNFVGCKNYIQLFSDHLFLTAIKNTVIFTAITVPSSIFIGGSLALLSRVRRTLSMVYEAAFSIPCAVSTSAIAMIFQLLLMPSLGLINKLIGINVHWLYDKRLSLLSLSVIQIWISSGFAFIFVLVALRNIPQDILEAAWIDGAGNLRIITTILLPLISPTVVYLFIVNTATSLMMMSLSNILTGGGPMNSTLTVIQYTYQKFISTGNATISNSASVVSFSLSLILVFIVWFCYHLNQKDSLHG